MSILGNAQVPNWTEIDLGQEIQPKKIAFDSLGFLWLLSDNGLFKYDGINILRKISPSSSQKSYLCLSQNAKKEFQIGTETGSILSLNPYDNKQSVQQFMNDSLPITFLNCPDLINECIGISYGQGVQIVSNGLRETLNEEGLLKSNEVYNAEFLEKEFILSTDQGLQKFSIEDGKIITKEILLDRPLLDVIITNIHRNRSDLWISYFSNAISNINGSSVNHLILPFKGKISKIQYFENSLYLSSEDGLFEYKNNSWIKKYPLIGQEEVLDFNFDEEGNVWIINGKKKLLKASLLFQKFNVQISQIQAIQFINNEIWIGNNEGLFIARGNKLVKVLNKNVTCLVFQDEIIWVGTYSDGFYALNLKGQILTNEKKWENYDNQSVLSLLPTSEGIYVSSLTGIVKVEYQDRFENPHFTSLNKIIGEGYYYQILKNENAIYFATDGEGIVLLENDTVIKFDHFEDNSKIESVYSMEIDNNNKLWFSSRSYGLGYLENGKAFKRSQQKTSSDYYTTLKKISTGQIIMIRSGSVDVLNPDEGNIIYHEKELKYSEEAPFLNSADVSFNKVYFSHNDFVYEYNHSLNLRTYPDIQIDKILVNLNIVADKNIFKQEQNNFQFNYSGSWLTDPTRLTFKYKLDNFDSNWRYTKDRSVSYPKLEPGKYNFYISASENNDFNGGKMAHYQFKISRYFYNTYWFWGILLISLVSALILWRDDRKRIQLKQSEIERKHIETQLSNLKSQLNPHFLFNSFNTLMGLIEEDQSRSIVFVEKLTDFYRQVLEQGKNQLIRLNEELKLVNIYVDILNERFDNALKITMPKCDLDIFIPPLTIQLLVENAVKHNEIGQIKKLNISIYEEQEFIVVKNNLIPKKYEVNSTGNGLDNIQKRYLLLNDKPVKILKTDEHFIVSLPKIYSTKVASKN